MQATCPHCGKDIEIVGAGELDKDYGIGANRLQHARERGKFPEPWLQFGNRNIWLRSTIEEYLAGQSKENASKAITQLQRYLDTLPPEEAAKALEALRAPSEGKGGDRSD